MSLSAQSLTGHRSVRTSRPHAPVIYCCNLRNATVKKVATCVTTPQDLLRLLDRDLRRRILQLLFNINRENL